MSARRSLTRKASCPVIIASIEGLAPRVVETLRERVRTLNGRGLSIVLAEQNLGFALALSDTCHIMEKGEIIYSGTPDRLRENRDVLNRYLTLRGKRRPFAVLHRQ